MSNQELPLTLKPARSSRRLRKQRLPPQPPARLPDSVVEMQAPPLQLKSDPPPPTPHEQQLLQMLWTEFTKADDAARAASRFEADVHERQVQQRLDEGLGKDEAGNLRRVFNADDFNETFRKLLQLRLERNLIKTLELGDYETEILHERIQSVFGRVPVPTKQIMIPASDQLQIGDAATQQVQDLKQRGRRRRR